MKIITLSSEQYYEATNNIIKYFGCARFKSLCLDINHIDVAVNFDIDKLINIYTNYIDKSKNQEFILNTLLLLTLNIKRNLIFGKHKLYDLLQSYLRADLLKLYILLYSSNDISSLSIKTSNSIINLNNHCNWFMDDMVRKYLRINLSDINNVDDAQNELKKELRKELHIELDKKRDLYPVSQISRIIWGIYSLLNDNYEWNTPVPTKACHFILEYLNFVDMITLDSNIDSFWIKSHIEHLRLKNEN